MINYAVFFFSKEEKTAFYWFIVVFIVSGEAFLPIKRKIPPSLMPYILQNGIKPNERDLIFLKELVTNRILTRFVSQTKPMTNSLSNQPTLTLVASDDLIILAANLLKKRTITVLDSSSNVNYRK